MKNYQEMDDGEINCEVLRVFHPDIEHMCMSESGDCFYHCGPDGNGFYQIDVIDYCNSWADAGPIIQENRITIINENLSMPVAVNDCYGWYCDEDKPLHCRNENPLRAAMILFLMMKGGE